MQQRLHHSLSMRIPQNRVNILSLEPEKPGRPQKMIQIQHLVGIVIPSIHRIVNTTGLWSLVLQRRCWSCWETARKSISKAMAIAIAMAKKFRKVVPKKGTSERNTFKALYILYVVYIYMNMYWNRLNVPMHLRTHPTMMMTRSDQYNTYNGRTNEGRCADS